MAADPADVPTDVVPTTLRVVTCRTAMSPGGVVDAARVVCPARGEGVPIEECLRCPRIVDFVRDSALAVSVIRCFAAQQAHVASLLVRDVLCVGPHLAADEAAEVLVRAGVTEAVVVDSRRHPIGIVEEADLLAAAAEPGPRRTVGALMSAVAITLVETASIATAAALIARDRTCAVPVVDSGGRVIGLLTPFDLVGWLAPPPSSGP
jgi:CBS domain-containing protein